jgi:hypothetical protein
MKKDTLVQLTCQLPKGGTYHVRIGNQSQIITVKNDLDLQAALNQLIRTQIKIQN